MNRRIGMVAVTSLLGALLVGGASAQVRTVNTQVGQSGVELGLTGGMAGGLGAEGFVHVRNVAGPVGVKVGASYNNVKDPIQDPEITDDLVAALADESGKLVVLGVDGTYSLGQVARGVQTDLYAGGRYGMFDAAYTVKPEFGGGKSTLSTNALGIGGGLQVSYPISSQLSLMGDLGVDHFFDSDVTFKQGDLSETLKPGDDLYDVQRDRLNFSNNVFKAKVGVKVKL